APSRCRAGRWSGLRARRVAPDGPGSREHARSSGRAGSSWSDLPGERLAAELAIGPAGNDRREEPGAASGMDDLDAALAELGNAPPADGLGQPLRDAERTAHQIL